MLFITNSQKWNTHIDEDEWPTRSQLAFVVEEPIRGMVLNHVSIRFESHHARVDKLTFAYGCEHSKSLLMWSLFGMGSFVCCFIVRS